MSLKAVTFTQPTRVGTLYNTGEVAGFEADVANRLIEQGFAKAGEVVLDVPEPPQRFQGEAPVVARPAEITPEIAPIRPVEAQVPPAAEVTRTEEVPVEGTGVAPGVVKTTVPAKPKG